MKRHQDWPKIVYNPTMNKRVACVVEPYDPSTVVTVHQAYTETERLLNLAADWADGDIFKQIVIGILRLIHMRLQVK